MTAVTGAAAAVMAAATGAAGAAMAAGVRAVTGVPAAETAAGRGLRPSGVSRRRAPPSRKAGAGRARLRASGPGKKQTLKAFP